QASIDDPIELVIDYGAQVETLVTSLELGWELDTPITFPHVATTFIVHWLDSAGQTQTTSHTIMLSFNYLGT
ncbi:MAG: hypothetical protein KAJ36_08020, partial [Candidatus Thorarchaeota archaeon]|nr:hypothetical protein [Candidatus Thorarchaeota archaeon]